MPPKPKQAIAPVAVQVKPDNRILPTKEQAVFRTLLQLFEHKDYKKGLKTAEGLLKNHPEHGGESLGGPTRGGKGERDEHRSVDDRG